MELIVISTPIGFLGSGKGGGVEVTLNSLVSGLLELGHKVKVIAPEKSTLSESCKHAELFCVGGEKQESWQHIEYHSHISIPKNSIVSNLVEKALILGKNCDAVINLSYDWLPISRTINADIPIMHLISMGDESYQINHLISKVYSLCPDNFAFHTNIQAADYPFISSPIILGNGFELSDYNFKNKLNGPLAWVGRVAPEKGLEDAVNVAYDLGEKLNVWGFLENKNYAKKIEKLFPADLINWKGFVPTSQLQEELGECRALINTPKWNEAYGNVVVEAMACGVPVVAYKRGGPGEIIQHGKTGFLVEPDNKAELVSSLRKINTIKRSNCRKWVEQNASTKIFAKKVVKWIKKVICQNKPNF